MTPPDAMSWDEAVRVMRLYRDMLIEEGYSDLADEATAALAAIQSHRVQAEARVAELEAQLDDVIEYVDAYQDAETAMDEFGEESNKPPMKAARKRVLIAVAKFRVIAEERTRTALAAAANNDGGSRE